ncbi:MAG: hypothetical protein QM811_19130 [Pirellulales bacterium]
MLIPSLVFLMKAISSRWALMTVAEFSQDFDLLIPARVEISLILRLLRIFADHVARGTRDRCDTGVVEECPVIQHGEHFRITDQFGSVKHRA